MCGWLQQMMDVSRDLVMWNLLQRKQFKRFIALFCYHLAFFQSYIFSSSRTSHVQIFVDLMLSFFGNLVCGFMLKVSFQHYRKVNYGCFVFILLGTTNELVWLLFFLMQALEMNGQELFGRAVRLDVARERGAYTPQSGYDSQLTHCLIRL